MCDFMQGNILLNKQIMSQAPAEQLLSSNNLKTENCDDASLLDQPSLQTPLSAVLLFLATKGKGLMAQAADYKRKDSHLWCCLAAIWKVCATHGIWWSMIYGACNGLIPKGQ